MVRFRRLNTCSTTVLLRKKTRNVVIKEILVDAQDLDWSPLKYVSCTVHDNSSHIANLLSLIVNQFIFRAKCKDNKKMYKEVIYKIVFHYRHEKLQALKDVNLQKKFTVRWLPVEKFLEKQEYKLS